MLALTAVVAHMAGVIDHIPTGILLALDPEGALIVANQSARKMLGLMDGDRVSTDLPVFQSPHRGVPVRRHDLPLFRSLQLARSVPITDYEISLRDGAKRLVTMAARPLFNADDDVQGAVATLTDVTYIRTQERRVRHERDGLTRLVASERHIAQTLQTAHLPQRLPQVPGFHLSGIYVSPNRAASVGGDWYDAFRLRDGRIGFSIGDVMGHGLEAAVTMGKLRQAMQSVAFVQAEPSIMLDAANATLAEHDEERIATAVAGVLDPKMATLSFAAAGHPLPMLRRSDGMLVAFEGVAPPLGVYEAGDARNHFARLEPGDLAVFYTDGLIEATRDAETGEQLLQRAVLEHVVPRSGDSARALLRSTMGKTACVDDVAILTVAREKLARTAMRNGQS
jgi:sigma-B regulation protein RsbU (phosphoserine phosphatase)